MEDDEGFHAFVVARRTALLRSAWWLTGDWHRAEDLVQTALLRVYSRWAEVRGGNPDAYIRRVMFTIYANWGRRRWGGELSTDSVPETATDADEAERVELRIVILDALAELPPRQRAAVVLRYYEDLSETETAQVLGCSLGTVKSQVAKALMRLRARRLALVEAETEAMDDSR